MGVSEYESRGILDILYADRDYADQHRVMHRITLRGDEPRGSRGRRLLGPAER